MDAPKPAPRSLLAGPPKVVNVGLEDLAADLVAAGAQVRHVAWVPPARGEPRRAAILGKLGT